MLNDSFLSIVAHTEKPGTLLVRARKAGDIEALFPQANTWVDEGADYHHRAEVPAAEVARAIAARVAAIDYRNFKGSVADQPRHDAYMKVWEVMWQWGKRAKAYAEAVKKRNVLG